MLCLHPACDHIRGWDGPGSPAPAANGFMGEHFADVMDDDEGPGFLLFSASPIIAHEIIRMAANTFNQAR
jgi:hypothetical protein